VELQPAVVLEPSFATTSTELAQRINGRGTTVSGRSSLVTLCYKLLRLSQYHFARLIMTLSKPFRDKLQFLTISPLT